MRPFISHAEQGVEAYLNGKTEADNPHREGSVAHIQWLSGHLFQKVDSGDLNETDEDCARVYHGDTVIEARRTVSRLRLDLPDAASVADAIDLPVKEWDGKCFAVSVAALESGILDEFQEKHGTLFPAYGIYDGPLASGRRGMDRHGWLESVEGHVVDPTRWCFTDEYPHLWASTLDDYDLAGMRLRSAYRPANAPKPDGPPIPLGINDLRDLQAFDRVLGDNRVSRTGMITMNRLHWLLNSPLEKLGADAATFIRAADRLGMGGLIPVDTRLWLEFSQNGYDPEKLRAKRDVVPAPRPKTSARFSPYSL
ncbi:hypothetical protein HFO56_00240 [Rhizobium laguerreae]|uniref:hypothetical protein n=1 Tax=Rhizobium laguerreae TaxID=1076926 RepID=UPI001C915C39|nr:hypothetical protein [Rhizobium laguerreae]MBY3150857.1 hypothetical protein [Rhizobium laguerreae]